MSIENSAARPRSKFTLSRSIQGEGSGSVSMVLQVEGAAPGAVTMVGEVSGGVEIALSGGPCGRPSGDSSSGPSGGETTLSGRARESSVGVGAGVNVVILFVFTISGSVNNRRFRGF